MNDTSPEIERLQHQMMMRLGSRRRLELACEMYMTARSHALDTIPKGLSEDEQRQSFVARMYGAEFARDFFNDEVN